MSAPAGRPHLLELLESSDARTWVAPGFRQAVDELGVLDPQSWRTRVAGASSRGHAVFCELADGREIVLRPFRHGGALGPLLRERLRSPDRLLEELRVTDVLARRGAPVPTPAFAVAHRQRGGWTGGVATLRIDRAVNALEYLRENPTRRSQAARAAGQAIRRFHDAGGWHPDLHIGNVMIQPSGIARAFVVDLDRARAVAPLAATRRARELARLERSLHKHRLAAGPIARSLVDAYVGSDEDLGERVRAALRRERARVALHRVGYAFGRLANRSEDQRNAAGNGPFGDQS